MLKCAVPWIILIPYQGPRLNNQMIGTIKSILMWNFLSLFTIVCTRVKSTQHRYKAGRYELMQLFEFSVSSVTQSCPALCDAMDCSSPGFPVHRQLPELTQTHVHSVGDAIPPSHPLLSPFPPALNLSQPQGLL